MKSSLFESSYLAAADVCCGSTGQLATSHPIPRVGFNATEKTQEGATTDSNNWIGFRQGGGAPGKRNPIFMQKKIVSLCASLSHGALLYNEKAQTNAMQ